MSTCSQITLDPETQRREQAKAAELGISFAEYVRRLLAKDLNELGRTAEISVVFDLVDAGPATNIARDKDRMVGEAVWKERSRKAGPSRRASLRLKTTATDRRR